MTRDALKKLIKECLIEILAEGVGSSLTEHVNRPQQVQRPQLPRPTQAQAQLQRRATSADFLRVNPQQQQVQKVSSLVSMTTKDPVLASILADTAKTTLVEQAEERQPMLPAGGDHAARVAAAYDPGQLIGAMTGFEENEQNARWQQAAFAPSKKLPGMQVSMPPIEFDPYAPFTPGK